MSKQTVDLKHEEISTDKIILPYAHAKNDNKPLYVYIDPAHVIAAMQIPVPEMLSDKGLETGILFKLKGDVEIRTCTSFHFNEAIDLLYGNNDDSEEEEEEIDSDDCEYLDDSEFVEKESKTKKQKKSH